MAIITGENTNIVKRRAEKLKIEDCFLGISDKVKVAEQLLKKYNLQWNEVAYIGDDINDIKLLEKVGLTACPSQSPDYIKSRVKWVLTKKGGEGVFREFVETYLQKYNLLEVAIDAYLTKSNKLNQ